MAHFRNRRCLAIRRRRLGRAYCAQARGGSLLLTFQIGRRGSRRQHPLPDRPPTLQAFRSVLSRTRPVSTHGFHGSRSYLRRHGVQFRRAHISYHKTAFAVYLKLETISRHCSGPPATAKMSSILQPYSFVAATYAPSMSSAVTTRQPISLIITGHRFFISHSTISFILSFSPRGSSAPRRKYICQRSQKSVVPHYTGTKGRLGIQWGK